MEWGSPKVSQSMKKKGASRGKIHGVSSNKSGSSHCALIIQKESRRKQVDQSYFESCFKQQSCVSCALCHCVRDRDSRQVQLALLHCSQPSHPSPASYLPPHRTLAMWQHGAEQQHRAGLSHPKRTFSQHSKRTGNVKHCHPKSHTSGWVAHALFLPVGICLVLGRPCTTVLCCSRPVCRDLYRAGGFTSYPQLWVLPSGL